MQRLALPALPDWPARAEVSGCPARGWATDAGYCLEAGEIERLEAAASALEDTCLDFVEATVRAGAFEPFHLTDTACRLVEESWKRQDKHLITRFDMALAPDGALKLVGIEAESPVGLSAAGPGQALWRQCHVAKHRQFNTLHERLREAWRRFGLYGHRVHFAGQRDAPEEAAALEWLRRTAAEAGIDTATLHIDEVGWNGRRFVDLMNRPITNLCKIYPWEWLVAEEFSGLLAKGNMRLIEPAWKMLLSSDVLLALLWQHHPDHPHLLQASLEGSQDCITRISPPFKAIDGFYPVLGAWVIASKPCALGIMESPAPPLDGCAGRFVPHYVA